MYATIFQYNSYITIFRKLLIRKIEENWNNIYVARPSLCIILFFITLKFAYQGNRRARPTFDWSRNERRQIYVDVLTAVRRYRWQ